MMTQTHSLIALTLFASPKRSIAQNVAILVGSFAPDAAIFFLFFWSKINRIPEQQLWTDIYFSEPVLTITAIGNSFPLYCSILVVFVCFIVVKNRASQAKLKLVVGEAGSWAFITGSVFVLFSLAAITHLLGDFPVHVDDAHAHFWPISDWRFESAVSYWNPNHHGHIFSVIEAVLGVVLSVIVFRRFRNWFAQVLTGLAILSYIAVPIYFSLAL